MVRDPTSRRAVLLLATLLVVGATLLARAAQGGEAQQENEEVFYGAQLHADPALPAKLSVLETRLHLAHKEIERLHGLAHEQQNDAVAADPVVAGGDPHGLRIRAQIRGAPPEEVNVNFTVIYLLGI